ncbi:MAG TPA: outer membrane lipoprotein carrier protein LolA [Terracidiphilus sp.]|jgi:outer membrane lipoprotein carrier protein
MSGVRAWKRGGLLIAAAALSFLPLFAQQTAKSAQSSAADVHALAQRIDKHYNQLHSLKAGFTESYVGLGIHRSESGTLLLLKPGRMRWDYSSPAGKLFLLDGKWAWFYTQGDPQVQRMEAKQLDDLRSPLRFLLGHTELEKELGHVVMAPAANGEFTLTGQPKGQEKRIPRLAVTATAAGFITAIEIEEVDGAITRFTFSGEEPNATVAPTAFRFSPPAGVQVIDAPPPV